MYEIRKSIELDAGHRVPYHGSKCHDLHGHRYKVTAYVSSPRTVPADPSREDSGMVVDFGVIKEVLMEEVHDPYDHKLLLWEKDPLAKHWGGILPGLIKLPCIPTAEELAHFWSIEVARNIAERSPDETEPLVLTALEVRETPTSFATYYV